MKFQGNTKEAGINGFQAIIRLGNSDERLGLDKIIADQKSRLNGPPAAAGSRHDGIRGLGVSVLTSLALRILLPPAVAAIELDHDLGSKEPTAGARGRGTWVVGDEITRTRARDSGNELLLGGLLLQKKKFGTRSSWRPVWFWFGVPCWLLLSSVFCFCYSVPFGLSPKQIAGRSFPSLVPALLRNCIRAL